MSIPTTHAVSRCCLQSILMPIGSSHIPEVHYNSVHPSSRTSSLEDQYNAMLVDNQHQREAQQNTHIRVNSRLKLLRFESACTKAAWWKNKLRPMATASFRALADQLFDGDQDRYAECRAAAINQLRIEPDRYREFITEDWETYVQRMEQDGKWGDHITLQAAADYYKITAHVYSHDPRMPFPKVLPSKHLDADRIIRLSHIPEVHYNSVHPSSRTSSLEDQYNAMLVDNQHQREAQQNTHPRQQPIEASAFRVACHP